MPGVRAWLEGLGLGQYVEAFEAERIQTGDLGELSEADLKQLGLPMGPRRRLLRAIAALAREPATPGRPSPKYAPATLATKIVEARAAVAGERKQVTVLFADVEGSTDLVQHLDAEAVSALFDPLQRIMMDAVHTYEGTVNEVLGDGIMAIFGAPIAHEDHALRACRAALDLQNAVQRWKEQSTLQSPARSIRLRVGLNSGAVVVRAINNDLTISYSAMGMTTHLAARMEQSAEPGTIRITADTLRLVHGMVEVRAEGEIEVKGVAEPVPVFRLKRLGSARTRLEAATTGLTHFVGRTHELRMLEARFAQAEAGCGQVVGIVGDPGLGKSRLLLEFCAQLGDRAAWAEGHSVSFGQAMAFHPLIDLLRRNFRIEDDDGTETIREKIGHAVGRIGADLEPALPYLFYLLGIAAADDPVCRLDPQVRRAETFDALRQLLLRAAERRPQVLVFEDLHWSDTATREFLSFLIDSVPRLRVLVLLTVRPGHDYTLGERTYATRLVLPNLSLAEAGELTEAVLASSELPPELRGLIQRKAEGNPFFVEEVIKALGETGVIRLEGARWVLGQPLDQIVVPDTIQDVLMSRIDRLDQAPRQALQLAAVIGREFTQRLLDRIAEIRAGTTTVLRELQAIELIYEKALFPELAFMFKHALTQDVAYGSLLSQRRRELHRQIGEAIEELYADRLAEHYAVLAHHFGRGEDWARAADYFEKAADRAAASFAVHEALALCAQALEALEHLGTGAANLRKAVDLHARMGSLCMSISDFDRAHGEHAEAAAIARQQADPAREGAAIAGMALASAFAHDFARGLAEADRAVALGHAIGSPEIVAAAQLATGFVQVTTGHLEQAELSLTTCLDACRSQDAPFNHANSSMLLGLIENWRGNYGVAITRAEEAIEVALTHHHAFALMQGQFSYGLARTAQGECDQALRTFEEGLALAEKLGADFFRSRFLNSLGWLLAECGDLPGAIAFNDRGVEASRRRQDPETLANCELNLADLYRLQGELALARNYLERTHGLVHKPTTSDWMKWRYSQHLFAGLGEVWLALGDPAKADDFGNQCLDLATRTGSKKYLARGWRLKGEIAIARLEWAEAEAALRQALAFAERVGNPTQLWSTHLTLGQLYRDTSRPALARAEWATARRVIAGIGQSLLSPELKQGFERSDLIREVLDQCRID